MICAILRQTTNIMHIIGFVNTFAQKIVLVHRNIFADKSNKKITLKI